jgi:hypothetical protein
MADYAAVTAVIAATAVTAACDVRSSDARNSNSRNRGEQGGDGRDIPLRRHWQQQQSSATVSAALKQREPLYGGAATW